ncbi:MAG TPA: ADOP family duplicated permease, partial [Acidobacteriaceae bacterium]|nr:ADOP family duplicated permease [Acidobacteriaceae bacterium]
MQFPAWVRSVASLFLHRAATAEEMDEELRSHIQHRADDLAQSGVNRSEAERRARIEFGGYEKFRQQSHEALGGNLLESFAQDVRFSVRVLLKSPGFVMATVVTLALAIGANAVVFSMLNGLVLHPLHVPDARSLYALQRGNETYIIQSYPDYVDLRDRNHSFDGMAAYTIAQAGLDAGENPSRSWLFEVSGNYFDALRIQPFLGRFFHSADEHGPNSAPYIVLAWGFWHSRFEDDRGVIGRVVQINKHPFTIVGVAPPEFHGTLSFFTPDFFVPLVNHEQVTGVDALNDRGNRWLFEILGHLKAGVTPGQAGLDLSAIGSQLHQAYPKEDDQRTFSLVSPGLHGNFFAPALKAFLAGLMLLAGLILLAACANLGSLFGARAADRSREVALRLALGSSRGRILRQLFTEAVLISLVGGAAGLGGSILLLHKLSEWQPFPQFPMNIPVNPDMTVYGVALLLSLVAGFFFGVVPVREVMRTDPWQIVKSGSRGRAGRRITVRDVLLVVQIAICAVLVTASMVAVRGLARSLHSNFGFEPRNAMLVETDLAMAGYRDDKVAAMQKRMIEATEAIPGVSHIGLVDSPPMHMGWAISSIFHDKAPDLLPANAEGEAITFAVSPGYLSAAQTTLLTGRNISTHDDKSAPRVVVVNQEFARKFFGSVSAAMGSYYKLGNGTRLQVVGIVEDGKYTANVAESPQAAMFLPMLQHPESDVWLVVRSSRDPQETAAAVRGVLHNLDPGLPCFVQTWNEEMRGALFASRIATASLGTLGMMGAMLSITGIFGMAAYSVSRRLRELGIRIALGAQRTEVLHAALGRAFKLLAWGSAAGL